MVIAQLSRSIHFNKPDDVTSRSVNLIVDPYRYTTTALCYGSSGGVVHLPGCPGWMALLLPRRRQIKFNAVGCNTSENTAFDEELFVPDVDEQDLREDVRTALRRAYA